MTPSNWCDSSSALQSSKKFGIGKMRRIEVGQLLIQELVKTKQGTFGKVNAKDNPAGIMSKQPVTGEEVKQGCSVI